MYNNPISNIDPLGDFATRVGAWLYKVFIGGGTIGQNSYGEWYVQKSIESDDGSAGISLTYGKGRSATTAYREKLLSQYESLEQEERMAQLGIYDPSLTMSQARQNFAGISSGVVIPNITVKPITITINTPKPVKAILPFAKGVLEKFTKHAFAGARHADLGLSVEKMAANGMKLIEQNASLLKAGDNTLVGTINGKSKSFKAFVKDGEIISVNMYPGVSNRITQGPVINFGNVIW
jgi:hypothetical protein